MCLLTGHRVPHLPDYEWTAEERQQGEAEAELALSQRLEADSDLVTGLDPALGGRFIRTEKDKKRHAHDRHKHHPQMISWQHGQDLGVAHNEWLEVRLLWLSPPRLTVFVKCRRD